MKFLIALSILASSSAFAFDVDSHGIIKCYEPRQQGEDAELVYKLKEKNGYLWLLHPYKARMALNQNECLETYSNSEAMDFGSLQLCLGQGQEINSLIPIEATYGQEEDTVYCERELEPWFEPVVL
ncbi:MAG: hypothetical protein ACLGHN_03535 [Bacteriovoracia bacterium]